MPNEHHNPTDRCSTGVPSIHQSVNPPDGRQIGAGSRPEPLPVANPRHAGASDLLRLGAKGQARASQQRPLLLTAVFAVYRRLDWSQEPHSPAGLTGENIVDSSAWLARQSLPRGLVGPFRPFLRLTGDWICGGGQGQDLVGIDGIVEDKFNN
ncbi:hypothetical protein I7I51_02441 [Histoplasma capsulatum]|uniref:Uncharacterized protein n=1 Tax=Ajellomyces capsulatus TaxID=5037 RepID=A0A8A1MDX7_AJECA|nr:predicted protein [Histoplasma mississippiense (nom. inval.)]EDN04482.1 predicted protein [Histoplasma mississippiense (nom. inval.)]QSS62702.1 hypothetical protein I7I51_02441 [Histoplasma capsulatum]